MGYCQRPSGCQSPRSHNCMKDARHEWRPAGRRLPAPGLSLTVSCPLPPAMRGEVSLHSFYSFRLQKKLILTECISIPGTKLCIFSPGCFYKAGTPSPISQGAKQNPEAQRRGLPRLLQLVESRGGTDPQALSPPASSRSTVGSDLQSPTEIFIA